MAKIPLEIDKWSRKTWMTDAGDLLDERSIFEIAIPGTHNSGSFSPSNTMFTRDQWRDIREQLWGGIRSFDFRIRHGSRPDEIVFYHGDLIYDDQNFAVALEQISTFVRQYPKELIIIRLDTYLFNKEEVHFAGLVRYWLSRHLIAKPKANPANSPDVFSLKNLRASGNVILLTKPYWGLDEFNTWPIGEVFSSYSLRNPSEPWSGDLGSAFADMDLALATRPQTNDRWAGFAVLDFGIWTTNNGGVASYVHETILMLLKLWVVNRSITAGRVGPGGISAIKPGINQRINIVQCDFFDYGTDSYLDSPTVRRILILNDPRIRGLMDAFCVSPSEDLAAQILDAWS